MATMIKMTAAADKIEQHVRLAYKAGAARGGKIADAAKARLEAAIAAVDLAAALRKDTRSAEEAAWALVGAEDEKADRAMGLIRDTMWYELGRPRHSPTMDQVFPGGVTTYTAVDPREQPTLMQVLHSRLLAASAPAWTTEQRTEWAAKVDALRIALAAAVEAHRPVAAQAAVADATYRTAVRAALVGLQYFKRDLLNFGFTESQVHDIIPDATPPARAAAGTPKPPSQPTTTPMPATPTGDTTSPVAPGRATG